MKSLWKTAMLLIPIAVITLFIPNLKADAKTVFTDVQADSYYYESVLNLSSRGVINGYGDGTFKPNQPVTREHAAVMLVKSLQIPTSNIKDPHFQDISEKHPYYKEIAAVVDTGIFSGYEDKNFRPKEPLTRGQMATILTRAFDFSEHVFDAIHKVLTLYNKESYQFRLIRFGETHFREVHVLCQQLLFKFRHIIHLTYSNDSKFSEM